MSASCIVSIFCLSGLCLVLKAGVPCADWWFVTPYLQVHWILLCTVNSMYLSQLFVPAQRCSKETSDIDVTPRVIELLHWRFFCFPVGASATFVTWGKGQEEALPQHTLCFYAWGPWCVQGESASAWWDLPWACLSQSEAFTSSTSVHPAPGSLFSFPGSPDCRISTCQQRVDTDSRSSLLLFISLWITFFLKVCVRRV